MGNISLKLLYSIFFRVFIAINNQILEFITPILTFYITVLTIVPPRHIRKSLFDDLPILQRPKYETWAYIINLFNTGLKPTICGVIQFNLKPFWGCLMFELFLLVACF